jgi:hypothetical protein
MAAMAAELTAHEIPVPASFNGRKLAWLQLRLTSVNPSLAGLMAEFAAAEGATNWSGVGSFDPFPEPE